MWSVLPAKGVEELCSLFEQSRSDAVLPIQTLVNYVPLLAKPDGGERDIALTSLFHAVRCKIMAKQSMLWELSHTGFWDDAVKGSSSLKAALRRRFSNEVADLNNFHTVDIFYDLEKFVATINPVELVKIADDMQYPSRTMDGYPTTSLSKMYHDR